jgi:hypothetical protein
MIMKLFELKQKAKMVRIYKSTPSFTYPQSQPSNQRRCSLRTKPATKPQTPAPAHSKVKKNSPSQKVQTW